MGTRSVCGVRIDGQDKLNYNQFDGYPEGLGQDLVNEFLGHVEVFGYDSAVKTWKHLAHRLKLVDESIKPTPDQIAELVPYTNLNVGDQTVEDWYCLLRETQGSVTKRLAVGYALDANDFILESLHCEWAYVFNLDEETLEVYEGFQNAPHDRGRYADSKLPHQSEIAGEYYPCALIATFPLRDLPENLLKAVKSVLDDEPGDE